MSVRETQHYDRDMLIAGDFPLPCTSSSLLSPRTSPNPSPRPLSLFPLPPLPRPLRQSQTHLKLRAQRTDWSTPKKSRSNKNENKNRNKSKRGGAPMLDMESLGLGPGLGAFDDGDGDGDEDDDDEEGVLMPLERMREWLENRPRGFGEGKVYDTGLEEQMLDEMRQSREAQAANITKLKSDPLMPGSGRDEPKKKANELAPNGIRVRVTNLPKKKNVHRDLSASFKDVRGMISINPVVSGNKKTRDPICKGSAFVYFKSVNDANRFVETFSRQSILFGKIQKQIKCEMVDSKASDTELLKQSTGNTNVVPEVEVEVVEEDQTTDYSDIDESLVGEFDNTVLVELDDPDDDVDVDVSEWEDDEEDVDSVWEDDEEDLDSVTELELNNSGSFEQKLESESESVERVREPVKRLRVKDKGAKASKRNTAAKGKEVKAPKLVIPGSAKRLKVKEKAVLTDVFSKYGKKSVLASKKER